MTGLAAYLDVLLRGLGLVGFCAVGGGVVYAIVVLRTASVSAPAHASLVQPTLRIVGGGALAVALAQAASLTLKLRALAAPAGGLPVATLLDTDFGRAAAIRIVLALLLMGIAWRLHRRPHRRGGWAVLGTVALALTVAGAWLSHAQGRPTDRAILMALDVVHRTAVAVWIGGLMHLLAGALGGRGRGAREADPLLRRFSAVALGAAPILILSGVALTVYYVGSVRSLVGTAYGVMVLSKVVLLGALLGLGALNFLAVRRMASGSGARIGWLVEAELGIALTVLLAAASLASAPPAVDVAEHRVAPGDVAAQFAPRWPRLASPSIDQLLAVATPISDVEAPRQPEEYAWSEYNHHTAGLFVLAMGLLACLDYTRRARWARHWPLLLLGLAAFLFVRNDPEAWPLGPLGFWETLALPEVLQHRLAVALTVGLGVFEWSVRTDRIASPGLRLVFPILCAAAGTLLLVHSHDIANVRTVFFTEVSHVPLGILGVVLAWGRWLELRLPAPHTWLPGGVWRVAMIGMGVLLLFYREGDGP